MGIERQSQRLSLLFCALLCELFRLDKARTWFFLESCLALNNAGCDMKDNNCPPNDEVLAQGCYSDAVLDRLGKLHPKIIDLSLGRTLDLLERLGRPQDKLPPVIHVAGTNGKGSLIAYLRAMLEAADKKVHVYTSPHLVRFHERIRVAGKLITEEELTTLLEGCEKANDGRNITFFEITTVAGFYAFSQTPADALLLETGLGGEFDSTNVVDQPHLTAITPISIDHTQYLGDTMELIAKAKAGIIKPGVPCVVARQRPEVLAVVKTRAAELGAPLYVEGEDWSFEPLPDDQGVFFKMKGAERRYSNPSLLGEHQLGNAALAVACAEILQESDDFGLSEDKRNQGLQRAYWPGRMQHLDQGRLRDLLRATGQSEWDLWLDGGHNESAGQALSEIFKKWDDKPLHLVYGMLNTKAACDYLRPLAPHADSLRAIPIPGAPESLTATEAAREAEEAGFDAKTASSAREALEGILAMERPGRIIICGSLYLAGAILRENGIFQA